MHNIEEYHENYWSGMVGGALSIVDLFITP
jgi:hypothetical protein